MKPKIFYLSTSMNIGGTEKWLYTFLSRLKNDFDFSVGYIKVKGYYGEKLEREGIPVYHLPGFMAITSFLKNNSFDLLHTFLYRANILGRMAGTCAQVPAIVSSQQSIDAWKSFYHVWADAFTTRWCDMIIANSLTAKEVLMSREKIQGDKIKVVYNGLEFNGLKTLRQKNIVKNELKIKDDEKIVLYIGRLHREKGADFLPSIIEQVRNAVFVIAGDGPERETIENALKKKGLFERARLLGWRQDIQELMQAADLLILPSREESFPQVVLEAMYFSLPIVAMNVGGVKELINSNTGVLVEQNNLGAFTDAIEALLHDPQNAKRYTQAAHEKSLEFSEQNMIKGIYEIYTSLLTTKKRRINA